jgi:hypothetical protein
MSEHEEFKGLIRAFDKKLEKKETGVSFLRHLARGKTIEKEGKIIDRRSGGLLAARRVGGGSVALIISVCCCVSRA